MDMFLKIAEYFKFKEAGSDYRTEVIAGVTTFMTMAYIIFVNPSILASPAGSKMPFDGVLVATCIASAVTTIIMGLYAHYPIALAPGMGLNAFFSFMICGSMGVPWPVALGMVFISGLFFIFITLTGLREMVIDAVPQTIKYATACGIGAFIAFIGLRGAGIVVSNPETLVAFGNLESPGTLLAIGGLIFTAVLLSRGVNGAILLGLLSTGVVGVLMGLVKFKAAADSQAWLFFDLDILSALNFIENPQYIVPIVVLLFFNLFDTVGTLIGVSEQAGFMVDGKLPRAKQALMTDAVGTCLGAVAGTSTICSYIESASGVSEGGRTGFANMVTAFLFLAVLGLLMIARAVGLGTLAQGGSELGPITAPALIVVGTLMMTNVAKIEWGDFSEALPGFLVILLMPLTYSISAGLAAGFVSYPLIKLLRGEGRKVHPLMYVLAGLIVGGYISVQLYHHLSGA